MFALGPGLGVGVELGGEGGDRGLAAPGALEVHEHEDLLGDAQGVEGRHVDRRAGPTPSSARAVSVAVSQFDDEGAMLAAGFSRRQDGRVGGVRRRGPRTAGARRGPRAPGRREGAVPQRLDARQEALPEGSQSHSEFPLLSPSSWGTPVASTPRAVDRFGGPADSESPVTLRPHLAMGLPFRRCRLLGAPNWRSRYQGGKRECKGFLAGRATFPHPMMRCARACRRVGERNR